MPGQCSVCHIVGPPDRSDDFLCEDCAHPDEIRSFCASCGDRRTLVAEMGLEWLAVLLPEVPHECGTAIRLERCPACAPGVGLGVVEVHRIRADAPSGRSPVRRQSEVVS